MYFVHKCVLTLCIDNYLLCPLLIILIYKTSILFLYCWYKFSNDWKTIFISEYLEEAEDASDANKTDDDAKTEANETGKNSDSDKGSKVEKNEENNHSESQYETKENGSVSDNSNNSSSSDLFKVWNDVYFIQFIM